VGDRVDRTGKFVGVESVGEQVDVLAGPVDHTVSRQRVPTCQGESEAPDRRETDPGEFGVAWIHRWRYATARGASSGNRSSHCRRHPAGKASCGHSSVNSTRLRYLPSSVAVLASCTTIS